MIRRVLTVAALVGPLTLTSLTGAVAQQKANPCAAKNPCAAEAASRFDSASPG